MLEAPVKTQEEIVIDMPVVEELNDSEESTALVVATSQDTALVVAEPSQNQFDCVVSHGTVIKVAGFAATTVGPVVGGIIGNAVGYELGEKVSAAVKETVKESGDKIAQQILEATGMSGIPGAELLVQANITGLAHEAGEMAYQETVKVSTTKGAAVGGVLAGGGTVVALESLNLFGYLYNEYVSPSITSYFDARREAQLRAIAEQMDAEQRATEALENDDWVLVGEEAVDADSEKTLSISSSL